MTTPRGIRNNNLDAQRAASRRHYTKHREQEVARCAAWNKANKDKVNAAAVARRRKLPPSQVLLNNAKNRAKARGLEFDLTVADLVVPERCPVLGIPLVVQTGHARDASPSVDRIDPARGYVRGNVRVISHKANTIKSNSTAAELRAVLRYVEAPL